MNCDIIIPVCNMLAYTKLCLEKLLENTLIPFNLIIIDNGSADGTENFFLRFNPSTSLKVNSSKANLKYIRNEENIGPILAYNQGIKRGDSSYICMMHNDVLIFQKGWLGKILNITDSNEDIGIVGLAGRKRINKIGLVDESSLVHNLQNEHLNSPMKNDIEDVAVIDGLCFMVRRGILEKTGGLNEDYGYMHCYDLDISMASLDLGYRNVVVNTEAMHISNGGITRKTKSYKDLVKDDYKLLNINYRKFRKKWKRLLPVEVK